MSTANESALDRLAKSEPTLARELPGRVSRGAALLDRAEPGWAVRVAADDLAMESCYHCILGQLYGGFGQGWSRLLLDRRGPDSLLPSHFGFTLRDDEQHLSWDDDEDRLADEARFGALADLWRVEVAARTGRARP